LPRCGNLLAPSQIAVQATHVSVQVLMLAGLLVCSQGQAQNAPARVPESALPSGLSQKAGTPLNYGTAAVNPATGRVTATLTQTDATNIVDWKSFDIGRAAQLNIVQPSASAVLLNKVAGGAFDNKTVIEGVLQANGRVYLYNPNGIVFGKGGEVNTAGLIASTLRFDESRVTGGLLRQGDGPVLGADPALGRAPGAVVVEGDAQSRASIRVAGGGLALLAGPNVSNHGTISAPDGQVVLAAGSKVYLAAPNVGQTGTSLRGVLVEVSNDDLPSLPGGSTPRTAENGVSGRIEVGRGNATMVGYAVNQKGLVSATTTVNLNGSIFLRAQDQAQVTNQTLAPTRAGPLVFGAGSVTEVKALADDNEKVTATAIFNRSQVTASGLGVEVQTGARILAPGGNVALTAKRLYDQDPGGLTPDPRRDSAVRVDLAAGSVIDVSGSRGTTLPMSSNVIEVELRGTELADNVVLRESPLYAGKVRVDVRQGTPIANISGYLEQRQFGLGELNAAGGTVSLTADAAVIQRAGSRINVDGGWVDYLAGKVNTSQLRLGNSLVDVGSAKAGVAYTEIVNLPDSSARTEAGYRQGASAGTVALSAPIIVAQGELSGQATRGARQRDPSAAGFPLGGSLQIGNQAQTRYEGLVSLGTGGTPGLNAPAVGADFDQADPGQSTLAGRLDLDTRALVQAGFSRLSVQTRGDIVIASPVALPAGGQLRLDAAARGNLHEGETNAPEGGHLSINAPVAIPSGTLTASAVGLDVASGVTLDAAGRWTNDLAAAGAPRDADGQATGVLSNRGGSVSLAANRLQLGDSVQIDVSAGASVSTAGRLTTGSAGSVSLRASTADLTPAGLAASRLVIGPGLQLRGYGFSRGGTLTLQGSAFVLGNVDAATVPSRGMALAPGFFQQGGFTSYEILAGQDLTLAAGATVQPRAERWQFALDANTVATGSMSAVARPWLAPLSGPSDVRAATNLTLRASTNAGAVPGDLRLLAGSQLDLDPGASVTLSSAGSLQVEGTVHAPGGRVTMSLLGNTGHMWFGSKSAVLAEGSDARLYTDGNGVSSGELLDGGRIMLGGALGTPDRFGSTTVDAAPGAIVMQPGAVFNVGGVGLGPKGLSFRSNGGLATVTGLGSAGGSIEIRSRTALDLLGSFVGGGAGGAKGGSITIGLDSSDAPVLDVMSRQALASRSAQLLKTTYDEYQVAAGTGAVVADNLNAGKFASVTLRSSDTLAFGLGKGDLTLSASSVLKLDAPTLLADSGVRGSAINDLEQAATRQFESRDPNVVRQAVDALKAADRARGVSDRDYDNLDIEQAVKDLAQWRLADQRLDLTKTATLRLSAPAVQLGNGNRDQSATEYPRPGQAAARSALAGNADLRVDASNIDLVGHSALQGFGTATLSASQDVRLIGIDWYDPNTPVGNALQYDGTSRGSFWVRGQLDLRSAQVYPTTLTDFTLAVEPTADAGSGRLGFSHSGQVPGAVLSAGGSLTAYAPQIVQAGRVVAPQGRLVLGNTDPAVNALITTDLTYREGSVTSVAGAGPVPLGVVTNGSVPTASTWTAQLPGGTDVELSLSPVAGTATPQRALPSKAIVSSAGRVTLAPGATLDLSGGGSVFAYGFTPGRGGSQDVLANNRPGTPTTTFAILPGFSGKVAPVDGGYGVDGGLAVGDAVWLSAQGQLPAGLYTLLPAHYALMPGGFSISVASGTRDMQPNANQTLADGSYLVAGRLAQAGNGAQVARNQGFAVAPGQVVRQRSEFALYDADTYFKDKAQAAGLAAPDLPRDGGHVVFSARDANANALRLDGGVRLAGAASGVAGLADIAAQRLEITASPGVGAAGAVRLSAGQLSALQARSLSLGAVRTVEPGGTRLDVRTADLLLANDAAHALTAPELILGASGSLRVEAGAALRAQGSGGGREDLLVDGGSAVLRATGSAAGGSIVRVSSSGPHATLGIGRDAQVAAGGSLQIDSEGRSSLGGTLAVDAGGKLTLAVPAIALGDAVPATAAAGSFTFSSAAVRDWSALSSLSLTSRDSAIGVYGPLNLGGDSLQRLTLGGPGLSWFGDAGLAQLRARVVRLQGADRPAPAGDAAAGVGLLQVQGGLIELGSGSFSLQQFGDVSLAATGDLRIVGAGSVLSTGGSMGLDASRITVASNADGSLRAGTAMVLSGSDRAGTAAVAEPVGFGGRLAFEADTIRSRALIQATSGTVEMKAATSLTLEGGQVSTAGAAVAFAGATAYSPGGTISLSSPRMAVGADATVDVSAVGADAGSLSLTAVQGTADGALLQISGTLRGGARAVPGQAAPVAGGRFSLDTDSVQAGTAEAFGALNARLNAVVEGRATGFTGSRDFRLRQGDVALDGNAAIVASEVRIAADAGSITLSGRSRIDASGNKGGSIELAARAASGQPDSGQVRMRDEARLLAQGRAPVSDSGGGSTGQGGRVLIQTATADGSAPAVPDGSASISLTGGLIDVQGSQAGRGGSVTLRAPRVGDEAGRDVAVARLDTAVRGAAQPVVIEAYKVYQASAITAEPDSADGRNLSAGTEGRLYGEARRFVDEAAGGISARLGLSPEAVALRPGVEVRSSGDLLVSVNEFAARPADRGWNLQAWRFGAQPVGLTLRAAGDLKVVGSISDGFLKPDAASQQILSMPNWALDRGPSADLRLVAGADFASARADGVAAGRGDLSIDFAARTPGPADYPLIRELGSSSTTAFNPSAPVTATDAPVALIRTGTGRIDLAAGRDVRLGLARFYVSAVKDETEGYPVIFDRRNVDAGGNVSYDVSLFGATVYTAGQAEPASTVLPFAAPRNALNPRYGAGSDVLTPARFAEGGGAVSVVAGRDVIGPRSLATGWFYRQNGTPATEGDSTVRPVEPPTPAVPGEAVALPRVVPQLVNNWLFRQGRSSTGSDGATVFETLADGRTLNTAWWTRPDYFNQGIATLGGGDITLSAGRHVSDLSVSVASNGYVPAAGAALVERGGGDVALRAGANVAGGVFYVQKGQAVVTAGASLTPGLLEPGGALGEGRYLAPLLALGDASARVTAGQQLQLGSAFNPTMTEQSVNNQAVASILDPIYRAGGNWDPNNREPSASAYRQRFSQFSNFSSYVATSALSLNALGGDLRIDADGAALASAGRWEIPNYLQTKATDSGFQNLYALMPPTLQATSFSGDVVTANGLALGPAASGQLSLLAAGSIQLQNGRSGSLRMLDNAPQAQSGVLAPRVLSAVDASVLAGTSTALEAHAAVSLHARDTQPAQVIARGGDVRGDPDAIASLIIPKATRIIAGRDIVDLGLKLQHSRGADDLSLLQAGRDVYYTTQARGGTQPSEVAVVVGGPGRLDLVAGRNIDLGNSSGIVTRGNLDNAYLGEGGAAVRAIAGVKPPDYARFVDTAASYGSVYDLSIASLLSVGSAAALQEGDLPAVAAALVRAGRPLPAAPGAGDALAAYRSLLQAELDALGKLRDFVQAELTDPAARTAAATASGETLWAQLRGLPPAAQGRFLAQLPQVEVRLASRAGRLRSTLAAGQVQALDDAFFASLVETGRAKELKPFDSLVASLFPDAAASAGGDISNFGSQLKTEQGGAITLFAPAGSVFAGLTVEPRPKKPESTLGIFTVRGGALQALVENDFLVNKGRVFTLGGGDIALVSQRANIDAGRGSKTAASAPPPLITIDKDGKVQVDVANSISGSGIATLKTRPDALPGDVFAVAPRGVFDAGDAGVRSSGSVLVVAPVVLNAANISAGGAISGAQVAVAAPALGAVAVPAGATARSDDVAKSATNPTTAGAGLQLSVEALGVGTPTDSEDNEENRKKRQRANSP